MNPFQQYLDLGWKLCRIEPGTKGPKTKGWNALENAVKSAEGLQGAGLLHAYSGTCAIDIDDMAISERYLQLHGIDLMELLMADDAVQISSGTPGRAKLIYRLDTPLRSIKLADDKLELRCATADGLSVQDVLPPSTHPSGRKYTLIGEPALLPALPEKLMQLWKANLTPSTTPAEKAKTGDIEKANFGAVCAELKDLLSRRDPDMHYEDWKDVGMICHHETQAGEEGFQVWNEWSAEGKKYPGEQMLRDKWASFGRSDKPLTIAGLRHSDTAAHDEFQVVTSPAPGAMDFMTGPKVENPYLGKILEDTEWKHLPQPTWIIEEFLPSHGLGCLYGPSKSGKSFLGIDLAISISNGQPWRGLALKPGPVVCIAAEGARGFRMRVDAARDARGLSQARVGVLDASPLMSDPRHITWLIETIKDRYGKVSMVLVDTMAAVIPGTDENSTKDMGKFMAYCHKLSNSLDTFTTLVHHTGKDESRGMRGSSALIGSFDAAWKVSRSDTGVRTIAIAKMKDALDDEVEHNFQLALVNKSCVVEWL